MALCVWGGVGGVFMCVCVGAGKEYKGVSIDSLTFFHTSPFKFSRSIYIENCIFLLYFLFYQALCEASGFSTFRYYAKYVNALL